MPQQSLEHLRLEQLRTIVFSESIDDLSEDLKVLLPEPNQLFASPEHSVHDRALEQALNESTVPLDLYWCFIGVAGGVTGQVGIVAGLIAGTVWYFVKKFDKSESKFKNQIQEDKDFFRHYQLKSLAADELIKQLQTRNYQTFQVRDAKVIPDPEPVSIMKSLSKGAMVGATFFGAIYLSSAWIFEEVGCTLILAGMTGPVGLGIAGGIALLLTLYCAYDYYKTKTSQRLINHEKEKATEIIIQKQDECLQLMTIANSRHTFFGAANRRFSDNDRDYVPAFVEASRVRG